MTVKDLRRLLENVPDHMSQQEFDNLEVLMPMTDEFDGFWKSPCTYESGVAELGEDEFDDSTNEYAFVIVSHGFFDEVDGVDPELN